MGNHFMGPCIHRGPSLNSVLLYLFVIHPCQSDACQFLQPTTTMVVKSLVNENVCSIVSLVEVTVVTTHVLSDRDDKCHDVAVYSRLCHS